MNTRFYYTVSIVALCLILISCGPAPQGERMPIPSATRSQSVSTESQKQPASWTGLPSTASIDVRRKPLLKTFFRAELNVTRLDDLYATTRGKVDNISIVSNCNLEVLKAFVVTGWAPVILLRRSGKGHLTVVMGYNDVAQQIQIGNPLGAERGERRLTYSDFEKEWATGSGQKCVLITPQKLNESAIHTALKKHLPEDQVARIQVRSR